MGDVMRNGKGRGRGVGGETGVVQTGEGKWILQRIIKVYSVGF